MNKRKAKQKAKRQQAKLETLAIVAAESLQNEACKLVNKMRDNVKNMKPQTPRNVFSDTTTGKAQTRKRSNRKRQDNKLGRFRVKGLTVDRENKQNGLAKGYDLRGLVWSGTCRAWIMPPNVKLENVR